MFLPSCYVVGDVFYVCDGSKDLKFFKVTSLKTASMIIVPIDAKIEDGVYTPLPDVKVGRWRTAKFHLDLGYCCVQGKRLCKFA